MQETRGCRSRVQSHYLWSPMWYGHSSQSLLSPLLNFPSSPRCILLWNTSRTHFIHNASHFLMLLMIVFPPCLNCRERHFVLFFPMTPPYFHFVYMKYLCGDVMYDLSQCLLNCYMAHWRYQTEQIFCYPETHRHRRHHMRL